MTNVSFMADGCTCYSEDDLVLVIQSVIFENLGIEDVKVDDHFVEKLKMDEPTRVEILLAIEHALGFKIDNNLLYQVNSIADAVKLYVVLSEEASKLQRKKVGVVPFSDLKINKC